MIKRIIAILLMFTYLFTSNTLVHSFCAKGIIKINFSHHCGCDDSGSQDTPSDCILNFSNGINATHQEIKKLISYTYFTLVSTGKEDNTPTLLQDNFLSEFVFDPPWQWGYIGIIKKIE